MKASHSKESGLTLVEVMTSLGILGLSMGSVLIGLQTMNESGMDSRFRAVANSICMQGIQMALGVDYTADNPPPILMSTVSAPQASKPSGFPAGQNIPATYVATNLNRLNLTGSNQVALLTSVQAGDILVRPGWVYRSVQPVGSSTSTLMRVSIVVFYSNMRGGLGRVEVSTLRSPLAESSGS